MTGAGSANATGSGSVWTATGLDRKENPSDEPNANGSGSASATTDSATGSGSMTGTGSGSVTGAASMKARTGLGVATSSDSTGRAACCAWGGAACRPTCRPTGASTVGTAARIVSSSERGSGVDGAEARVGSSGVGAGTGSWTVRATGGVSGTIGVSTSGSAGAGGGGESTSRALSRCRRLRVSTGLGTCLASDFSVFLRTDRMTMGSQPGGASRSSSLPSPDFSGAFAAGLRTPKVDGGVIRDPIMGSRWSAEEATAAVGSRREAEGVSEVPSVDSGCSPGSPDCCSLWCASQRPNRSFDCASWCWGSAAMPKRYGDTTPRVTALAKVVRGACNRERLTRCDVMCGG